MNMRLLPFGQIIPCPRSAGSTTLRSPSYPNPKRGTRRPLCTRMVHQVADWEHSMIGIGFSSKKASVERLPGWEQESWAYHGDDGKSFFGESQGQGRQYGPTFGANDTVGCGVNFSTGCAFFTKNGVFLGTSMLAASQWREYYLS